jgi:hypothetical protein
LHCYLDGGMELNARMEKLTASTTGWLGKVFG